MATASQKSEFIERIETAVPHERFTLRQRLVIWFLTWFGYLAVRLIAPTLRWSVSSEDNGPVDDSSGPMILCFWHRCVFMATHHYRNRNIAVMTSSSFDGEYIARIIKKFGYTAPRGSSTRGGVRALLAMHRDLKEGHSVAFTVDGPKGPMYIAKHGPVLLARNTSAPILCFHIAVDRRWSLNTWDRFIVPKPFARAHVQCGRLLQIPAGADHVAIEAWHGHLQATLNRIREQAEAAVDTRTPRNYSSRTSFSG